jgi:ubiquinone/menaquinone biosynthesis C-methylase UbiE
VSTLAQYRRRAPFYDLELAPFEPLRRSAIASLELRPGQRVLDLGCGTGLSLAGLLQQVGPRGHVIAIEQCPEMLERARQRVAAHGWRNVSLLAADVAEAPLSGRCDAALFHFTHDILQQPQALRHVAAHLKPGAALAATGLVWAPPWAVLSNLFVLGAALHSMASLAGLDRPWAGLLALSGELDLRYHCLGAVYQATGRMP